MSYDSVDQDQNEQRMPSDLGFTRLGTLTNNNSSPVQNLRLVKSEMCCRWHFRTE